MSVAVVAAAETAVLANDLKEDGFTIVSLHPGWVRTDMGNSLQPASQYRCTPCLQQWRITLAKPVVLQLPGCLVGLAVKSEMQCMQCIMAVGHGRCASFLGGVHLVGLLVCPLIELTAHPLHKLPPGLLCDITHLAVNVTFGSVFSDKMTQEHACRKLAT